MSEAIQRLLTSLDDLLFLEAEPPAEVSAPPSEPQPQGFETRAVVLAPMLGGDQPSLTGNEPALNADKTLPMAVEALHDPDFRERATRTLIRLGDSAVPALLSMMHDDDPEVRHAASWAVGQIADRRLAVRLRRGANWTYHALTEPHNQHLVARLVDALLYGSRESAVASAVALGRLRGRRALTELTEALNDPYPLIRLAALWALGQIGAEESIPHLADALYDPDHTIVRVAADALRSIGSPGALAAISLWQMADS